MKVQKPRGYLGMGLEVGIGVVTDARVRRVAWS